MFSAFDTPTSRALSIQETLSFRVVSDAQITQAGDLVAFCVSDSYTRPGVAIPQSEIYLADLHGSSIQSVGNGLSPRWSPDGQRLSFLSEQREPGNYELCIWRRDSSGSGVEVHELRAAKNRASSQHRVEATAALGAPVWSRDGTELAVLVEDPSFSSGGSGDFIVPVGEGPASRLYAFNIESHALRAVSPASLNIWEYDWSNDGRFVAVASDVPSEPGWYRAELYVLDGSGGAELLFRPPSGRWGHKSAASLPPRDLQLGAPAWSPDGTMVAFIAGPLSDRGLIGGDIFLCDLEKASARNATDATRMSFSWVTWSDRGTLLAAAWHQGRQAIVQLKVDGSKPEVLWEAEAAFSDRYQPKFTVSASGTFAVVKEDPRHARELWVASAASGKSDGPDSRELSFRQVSKIQPDISHARLGELRTLHWKAPDGLDIAGHLLLPPGYDDSGRVPLVLMPHGGPIFLHQYLFHGWPEGPYGFAIQLLAAAGIAVLLPNPRGSIGWGGEFASGNLNRHGLEDLDDCFSGVDYCIDQGIADPDRLGIGGWSSGGYLSAWGSCQTDRFKAALVGAAITDWTTMHAGRSAEWTFDTMFCDGDPYELGQEHDIRSPMRHASKVNTPTLIVHCENDPILPVDQAYAYYRALTDAGATPKLVIYPREGHAIREYDHIISMSELVVDWFGRWLLSEEK